jgi:threonine dehydrogenase-like Zn-dependent dehydrogenase
VAIMTGNLVAYLTQANKFELRESEMKETVGPAYVRIRISHCGVCGTDMSFYKGHRIEGYPISLGHEHCGSIVQCAPDVVGMKVGDQVAIDPNYRCGKCQYCLAKMGHLCVDNAQCYYSNRGYSRFIDIHYSYVHVLPRFFASHVGALVEPLSVAVHALSHIRPDDGEDDILILGAGSLGTLLAFALLSKMPNKGITIYDKNIEKAQAIRAIYGDRVSILRPEVGTTFPIIFEVTGTGEGFYSACESLSKAGKLVVLSRYHSCEPHIPARLPWKAPQIRFAHLNGHGESFDEAARILSERWTRAHDRLVELRDFNEIDEVFAEYGRSKINKQIICVES